MVVINDMILDATVQEILTLLQEELRLRGIDLLKDVRPTGDNIMVTCPIHKGGHETKPSCGIHVHTGVVHCFTCGYSVSLPEFIGNCLGGGYFQGVSWLQQNFYEVAVENRKPIDLNLTRGQLKKEIHTYVPEMVLDQYRYFHPYVRGRKISDEVAIQFDVGWDKETNCITFPVRDKDGNCLFVARRAVETKWFNYPAGAHKPIYGLYEWIQAGKPKEVVICESIFNCLTCWSHGIPAFALNGTGSKDQLIELSMLPVRSYVLGLDPDDAGRKGCERIRKACPNKLLYSLDYKDGRDLNDLENWEFDRLFSTKQIT